MWCSELPKLVGIRGMVRSVAKVDGVECSERFNTTLHITGHGVYFSGIRSDQMLKVQIPRRHRRLAFILLRCSYVEVSKTLAF